MQATKIEWTDYTANPVKYRDKATGAIVWACVKHSTGCAHCYAETLALRYGRGGPFTKEAMSKVEPFLCEKECRAILRSKEAAGKKCFLGDMTDIFGEWVTDDMLNRLFSSVLEIRTDVTFQLLTKRADRMQAYLSWRWGEGRIPARNIHVGVSVENQRAADERIPWLLDTPAAVRFLSCEPLLGPVELMECRYRHTDNDAWSSVALTGKLLGGQTLHLVEWVIVGSESGPNRRPMQTAWAASIVAQCRAADVAVFMKQMEVNGRVSGAVETFQPTLQVRQFPAAG